MSLRVEVVDPAESIELAGEVLRAAWKPPCLHYTPEYLGWQFGYPGDPAPVGVVALDGERPVGFAATVPRRLRFAGRTRDAQLLSFVAVHPDARGLGLGRSLYEALLGRIAEPAMPVVAFANPDTPGQRRLLGAFERAGYGRIELGLCRAHGGLPRPRGDGPRYEFDESADEADVVEALALGSDADAIHLDPTQAQWSHAGNGTGRARAVIRDERGVPVGMVQVAPVESLSAGGVDRLAAVTYLAPVKPSADLLRAVVSYAADRAADRLTSPMVVVQNPSALDPATLRAAGLRALPTSFTPYLFTPPDADEIAGARLAGFDVV